MKFFDVLKVCVCGFIIYKAKSLTTSRRNKQKFLFINPNNPLSNVFHIFLRDIFDYYKPSYYLISGDAQTILMEILNLLLKLYTRLFGSPYRWTYSREILTLSDGGQIAIDKSTALDIKEATKSRHLDRLMLIFPGITSDSSEMYITSFIDEMYDKYTCYVVNHRGMAGIKLKNSKMISAYCSSDLNEIFDYVNSKHRDVKVYATGFSYGGLLLTRYLGQEDQSNVLRNFVAGVGVEYPPCLAETVSFCESRLYGLYSKVSLSKMKEIMLENFDVILNENKHWKGNKEKTYKKINELNLYSQFDKDFTSEILGCENVLEYYENAKIPRFIKRIQRPYFSIFSEDDPIIPFTSVPMKELSENKHTMTLITSFGGHLAYFDRRYFLPWRIINKPIVKFFEVVQALSINSV